jgi:hypothetical protein
MAEWTVFMGRRSFQITSLNEVLSKHHHTSTCDRCGDGFVGGTEKPVLRRVDEAPDLRCVLEILRHEQYWPKITVPALNMTGWWDMNFIARLGTSWGCSAGGSADARRGQRLVMGPWPHWVNLKRQLSAWTFGPNALVDLNGYMLRFFDRWLRHKTDNGDRHGRPGPHFRARGQPVVGSRPVSAPGTRPTPPTTCTVTVTPTSTA